MIREFQTLLKIKNIYYMIPLIDLKNKSIGIDGDYFIRKYVDTSFKFKFDSLNLNKINIEKLFKYFNSLNIKILWVWGNTSLNCFKCTIPISEDINSILNCNYKINEKDTSLEYRVSKRTFIDNLLLKYNIDVIKSPGMASAQLVNACTLNIINYIFSDEETLLLDRCGLLITNLDPIFSNKTSVPVLIKSQILSTLGIGGKLFSYLCMSLGNLYCPTHPLFRYNFNPLKVFKFVIENMNTFSKLKESCNLSANNLISTNKVICNSEYHIWFMKFLYAENIFYKVLIFHEDYIGCLNNIPDCRSAFFGGELFTFNSINPFYNEIINKPIECTLCHKNLYTDLLKGINLLINKFEEFIPKKYLTKLLIKGNQLTLEIKRNKKEQISYLLQLIKIIICTNTDDLKLNPAYKLMIALMYSKELQIEDILFIKRHSLKYNSKINFNINYFNYKLKYTRFLELVKYLKMFIDNQRYGNCIDKEECVSIIYYMPNIIENKENNENKKHIKELKNYSICMYCLSHELHKYNMSLDYLIEYINEGNIPERHLLFYKGVQKYLTGFLFSI